MNEIIHDPQFKTNDVCELYSKKDGVPITYVCTSEVKGNNMPCDIFFRDTPHPDFGNRYFALVNRNAGVYIMNADTIEDVDFACIKDENGNFHYSQYRHDCRAVNGNQFVDGGRAYVRCGGNPLPRTTIFRVLDGEMVMCYE